MESGPDQFGQSAVSAPSHALGLIAEHSAAMGTQASHQLLDAAACGDMQALQKALKSANVITTDCKVHASTTIIFWASACAPAGHVHPALHHRMGMAGQRCTMAPGQRTAEPLWKRCWDAGADANACDKVSPKGLHSSALYPYAALPQRMRYIVNRSMISHILVMPSQTCCARACSIQAERRPLHLAALHGNAGVVPLLCSHNAQVNALDHDGRAPLHRAIDARNVGTAEALIDQGATATLRLPVRHPGHLN